jgi:hypothetical protein
MTTVLRYPELEMNHVDSLFSAQGELLVLLPAKHAEALASLIESTRVVQSWGRNRTPFLARLVPLAKGLLLTLRITIKHSHLSALYGVIALNSRSQTWEQQPDGHVLFCFKK